MSIFRFEVVTNFENFNCFVQFNAQFISYEANQGNENEAFGSPRTPRAKI